MQGSRSRGNTDGVVGSGSRSGDFTRLYVHLIELTIAHYIVCCGDRQPNILAMKRKKSERFWFWVKPTKVDQFCDDETVVITVVVCISTWIVNLVGDFCIGGRCRLLKS